VFDPLVRNHGIGQLVPEHDELAYADDEDNVSLDFDDSDGDSVSLTGKKSQNSDDEAEF
jgi:hypothetical protein